MQQQSEARAGSSGFSVSDVSLGLAWSPSLVVSCMVLFIERQVGFYSFLFLFSFFFGEGGGSRSLEFQGGLRFALVPRTALNF